MDQFLHLQQLNFFLAVCVRRDAGHGLTQPRNQSRSRAKGQYRCGGAGAEKPTLLSNLGYFGLRSSPRERERKRERERDRERERERGRGRGREREGERVF